MWYAGPGVDLPTICNSRAAAGVADECYGFVAAVAELVFDDQFLPKDRRHYPRTCVPHRLTAEDIIEKVGPNVGAQPGSNIKLLICHGFCLASFYVTQALILTFPCSG